MTPQPSPLSYYASQTPHHAGETQCSLKRGCVNLSDVFNRQKKVQAHIESIIGLPHVKQILQTWNNRQTVYWMRKTAGVGYTRFLPEILIVTGAGHHYAGALATAKFCHHAGIMNTNQIASFDVNDFIRYYVHDAYKDMEDAFRNYPSSLLFLYGFDKLIANPSPPIADWHDWVEIIVDKLLSLVYSHDFKQPVVFSMSTKSYAYLKQTYPRLNQFSTEKMICHPLNSNEMTLKTIERLKDKSYILSSAATDSLERLFVTMQADKLYQTFTEPTLRRIVMDAVLKRQESRLFAAHHAIRSRRKIKSITVADIPNNAVFAGENILFY